MKHASWMLIVFVVSAAAQAGAIDMTDPRRAVGTDDGIRIDAELASEFVSPHSPIGITYQIQNLSSRPIAVAERRCDATYDGDSRTITLSVGSEIPNDGQMPRLMIVPPGEKKTISTAATFAGAVVPRFVQIRVNVLRDLEPFLQLIEHQQRTNTAAALTDAQFDRWLEANQSIILNLIPVRFRPARQARAADASQR